MAVAAALAMLVGGVMVASAASSPRVMRLACATGAKQTLRYVARPSGCRGRLVRFAEQYPVFVCRAAPSGTLRLAARGRCRAHEKRVTLPSTDPRRFCAARRGRALRMTRRCRAREFPVVLRARMLPPPPAPGVPGPRPGPAPDPVPTDPTPPTAPPAAPVANGDRVSTGEDSPMTIAVLANDSGADGVASLDTSGTTGTVALAPGGTVTYDPRGHFDALHSGETAHDSFTYRAVHGGTPSQKSATVDVTVTGVNDAPTVATSAGVTDYTEDAVAVAVDGGVAVSDPDSTNIATAQVRIAGGFQPGDELVFSAQNGISGSYDAATGKLALTGSAPKASYQTALRSVRYRSGSNRAPGAAKTVEFLVRGTTLESAPATKELALTPVNDPPAVVASGDQASYTEGSTAVQPDPALAVSDPDSAQLAGATAAITGGFHASDGDTLALTTGGGAISGSYDVATGVLTLAGTASVASYEEALRSVAFSLTSHDPSTAARTVSFRVTDSAGATSPAATRAVAVTAANDPPSVSTSAGTTPYTQGGAATAVDASATVADPDSSALASARVRITSGLQPGDELSFTAQGGITGSYTAATGVLALSGSASPASYQAALRSVKFRTTASSPWPPKTVELTVKDAAGTSSAAATRQVSVTAPGGGPAVQASAGSATYTEGGAATAVDPGLTVSDPSAAQITGATVSLTTNFRNADGDALSLTPQGGITGSYAGATGVLTLTGTASLASYQAALRSVAFSLATDAPSTATRTVAFRVTDTTGAASNVASRNVAVSATNDPPVLATSGGQASYTEGGAPVAPDPALALSDPDSAQIGGATVAITGNYTAADGDRLALSAQNGITGTFSAATGVLALTGSASVASYRDALRAVTFSLTSTNPSTATRTVSFRATDAGGAQSTVATRQVTVTATPDPDPVDPLGAKIDHDLEFAASQLTRTLAETPSNEYPQEIGSDGRWDNYSSGWWTSGFFAGNLWLMFEATGDPAWRTAAQARQAGIESQKTNTGTHDLGFLIFDSFGQGFRLTGTTSYRDVALTAAASLATRYNATVGAVRSWNNPTGAPASDFRVIVDNMMNLELLFWASKHGGDPGLAGKALQHALTTAREHVRADGSTNHLVIFDSATGAVKSKQTVQGYSDTSTWARGQAWAVYGFTMAYRETGDSRMLATARKVADWYLDHLPADSVPYWDFQAPGIPNEPRDSSAAAVAASGLIELSTLETDATRKQRYLDAARATLTSLSSPAYLAEGTSSRSILLHGTANKPGGHSDRGLIYGDYFFLEALLRYRALPG